MKQFIISLLLLITSAFCVWTAKCPSWEIGTYTHHQCVSYGELNYYVAGPNSQWAPANDQIQHPGQPLADGTSVDPYDSYYGWWYCDSLSDSARVAICEKDFIYCADEGSGHFRNDTIFVYDTINVVDTFVVHDTVIKYVDKYDTVHTQVDLFDTIHTQVNLFDTTRYKVDWYDTVQQNVVLYDTSFVDVYDTNTITTTFYDTLFKDLIDTMYIVVDMPKVAELSQEKLTQSPKITIHLDSTLYKLSETDIVVVQWHYNVFDNTGHYISEKAGTDTVFYQGNYYDHEYFIFNETKIGLVADNYKRLGTGVYILKGSYILVMNGETQYREFATTRYGFKRND